MWTHHQCKYLWVYGYLSTFVSALVSLSAYVKINNYPSLSNSVKFYPYLMLTFAITVCAAPTILISASLVHVIFSLKPIDSSLISCSLFFIICKKSFFCVVNCSLSCHANTSTSGLPSHSLFILMSFCRDYVLPIKSNCSSIKVGIDIVLEASNNIFKHFSCPVDSVK